ncbi:MAG: hypothetical protein J5767_11160 [Paludibacteraceae bacterium]|nr:hypothetical protein [Paludibacteraceae bacterium]
MAKIFILGDKKHSAWAEKLGEIIPIQDMTVNEFEKIHNFVVTIFANANTDDKVIIDLDAVSESALALMIAMHLRLSVAEIRKVALIPILFVSNLPLLSFLHNGECSQIFLTLSGVAFCHPNMAQDSIEALEGLSIETYKSDFLDQIQIHPDAETGSHSMANQWGADVFNRIISKDDRDSATNIIRAKKKLYFKYVFANTVNLQVLFEGVSDYTERKQQVQIATGKNILLIDDEADKGWSDVLKKWFVEFSSFDVINEEIGSYDDIRNETQRKIDSDYYDLYLLDLRLLGTKEDNIYSANDFSGMKVLKAIKEKNRGNQVIILTASNKAWNMKALLDAGADGYYIKESPELKLPEMFSHANFESFKNAVEVSLNSGYKKQTFRKINDLLSKITTSKISEFTKNELEYVLKQSSKQVLSAKNSLDFAYAYMTLYQALEFVTKEYISETETGWALNNSRRLYKYSTYGKFAKQKDEIVKVDGKNINPSTLDKTINLYVGLGGHNDSAFINDYIRKSIDIRNAFIHNDTKKYSEEDSQKIYKQDGFNLLLNTVEVIITSII